jgi:hypothetical protein
VAISRYIIALLLSVVSCVAFGHQDSILTISPDGKVAGLPSSFGAVTISIRGLESGNPLIEFSAGGNLTAIQPCAAQLVRSRSLSQVDVSGSWYHKEDSLPYYVQVRFHDSPTPDHVPGSGYAFVFNLRDAQLISVKRVLQDRNWHREVDIDPRCKAARTMRSNAALERGRASQPRSSARGALS